MSRVAVERADRAEDNDAILSELKAVAEKISQRAAELSKRRGDDGPAVEDWKKAERELMLFPEFELVDDDGRFEVNVSASGFKPADVRVSALPDALIIRASRTPGDEGSDGPARPRDPGQKTFFRRFKLPEAIDVETVTANLDEDILHLTAIKATKEVTPN